MKLFLSYASEHKILADEVALALTGAGHEVLFDQSWLQPGDDYHTRIREAFAHADAMIFLISPEAVAQGAYALTELRFARDKWSHPAQRVLPVMVARTPLETIPPYLRAVTILEPSGNLPAEVADAVQRWESAPRASTGPAVRVTVHRAVFESRPDVPAYFVNVTNLFKDRDVEITHVWFESTPRADILQPGRPLPVRLSPYQSWETWSYLHLLPEAVRDNAFALARVRLSTGEIVESVENVGVPARGYVPGGDARSGPRETERRQPNGRGGAAIVLVLLVLLVAGIAYWRPVQLERVGSSSTQQPPLAVPLTAPTPPTPTPVPSLLAPSSGASAAPGISALDPLPGRQDYEQRFARLQSRYSELKSFMDAELASPDAVEELATLALELGNLMHLLEQPTRKPGGRLLSRRDWDALGVLLDRSGEVVHQALETRAVYKVNVARRSDWCMALREMAAPILNDAASSAALKVVLRNRR
jgi:hypothetical protein